MPGEIVAFERLSDFGLEDGEGGGSAAQPGLDFFYRPRSSVTRGQMAAFIIRTLGHTMARPKGLSAQYDGDEVGRGTDLVRLDVEPSEQAQGATTAKISTGFRGSKARFGTTVTFTVQLQDARGNDVSTGTDGQRPAEYELTDELLQESGTADGIADSQTEVVSKATRTVRTDSRGRITFSVSVPRTGRNCTANSCTRTFKLVQGTNAPAVAVNTDLNRSSSRLDGDVYYLEFSNADVVLANSVVRLTTANSYINVPSSGSAPNTATRSLSTQTTEPQVEAGPSKMPMIRRLCPKGWSTTATTGSTCRAPTT